MELLEYLQERQKSLGGSDVPAIMGWTPWRGPQDVYREKTEEITLDSLGERVENGDMKRGLFMEPIAVEMAAKKFGVNYSLADEFMGGDLIYRDRDGRPFHASPDAFELAVTSEDEVELAEVKAPRSFNVRRWLREGLPKYVVGQVMWQGAIIGGRVQVGFENVRSDRVQVQVGFETVRSDRVQVLLPDYDNWDVHRIYVPVDADMVGKMMAFAEEWWDKHIIKGIMPEEEVLAPEIDPGQVGGKQIYTLGPEWKAQVKALKEAYAGVAEAQAILTERQETFKKALGQDMEIVKGQGLLLYYQQQKGGRTLDKSKLVKELAKHKLNIDDFYKTGKASRPFKPYFMED